MCIINSVYSTAKMISKKQNGMDATLFVGHASQSISGSTFSKLIVVCALATSVVVLTLIYSSLSSLQQNIVYESVDQYLKRMRRIELSNLRLIHESRFEFTRFSSNEVKELARMLINRSIQGAEDHFKLDPDIKEKIESGMTMLATESGSTSSNGTKTVVIANDNFWDRSILDSPSLAISAGEFFPKPDREAHDKSFFLTACTMVKNEVPYIVEWIEFHKMQGVDRFIIYDGDSSDNVMYLNDFYQHLDSESKIIVLKSLDGDVHKRQVLNFQHCLERYGNSTIWMVNIDVDEFLHAPAFGTVEKLLRTLAVIGQEANLNLNVVTSLNLNFGSSGQQHRFENRLARTADGSVVHQNGCGPQLITDHVRRGPALTKQEEAEYFNLTDGLWICSLPGLFSPCRHNPGKTVFRPPDVELAGIHFPDRMRRPASVIHSDAPLLVGNHYYYRSREDVHLKAAQWRGGTGLPEHVRNYNLTDSLLWSRTADDTLRRRWGPTLARRMAQLTRYEGPCAHGVGRGAT